MLRTASEIAEIDRFLAEAKGLFGAAPEFGPSGFYRRGRQEWAAVWPICDDLGIIGDGSLRIIAREGGALRPTLSVIFKGQCVTRVDFAEDTECKINPAWAEGLGFPAKVCGNHIHPWEANSEHNERFSKIWELPCREPLPAQIRRFPQAFAWLADRINLVLTPENREFDLPRTLFRDQG